MNTIHGWQLNLHRCYSASVELQRRLEHDAGFVALLQEPYTFGGLATINPSGSTVFQAPRCENQRNRAAIVVSSILNTMSVPDYTDNDVVTVAVECSAGTVWYSSVYMPGDSDELPPSDMVKRLVHHCEYSNIPLLIGCDANAHNILWNSSNNNERGEALWDYLISTNLEICNRGHEPTFVVQNRREVLDLTLASLSIADEVSDWHVDSAPSLSDHRCIRFNLAEYNYTPKVSRNIRRTDWTKYTLLSQDYLIECVSNNLSTTGELDNYASAVTSALHSALNESCPLRAVGFRRKTNLWWTSELAVRRRLVKSAWNRAYKTDTLSAWESYRALKREHKYMVRNAKRSSWRSFCSKYENLPESNRIGKLLKGERKVQLDVLQKADGTYTSDSGETLELMMSVHYPGSVGIDDGSSYNTTRLSWCDRRFDRFITVERIVQSINSFDSFKSPGEDMVSPVMLQKAGSALVGCLVRIFRASLSLSHVPYVWSGARAVFIPKPGKSSYLKAKSFRPITLTSFFLKVLERLIYWHLSECIGGLNPKMHLNQFAFKQGYSTDAALHSIVQRLEKAVFNKQLALALFLDIEGAFSNVSLAAIRGTLLNAGIEICLVTWIVGMLRNQRVTAALGNYSTTVRLTRGTPQGGVLSPLLFNLVMGDLLGKLTNIPGIYSQAYADDVCLLSTGIDSITLCERIQEGLKVVEGWARETGLSLCSNKTFATMFTWKRKWVYRPLRLMGQVIQLVDRVTYLGVTLDSRLSWSPHIANKAAKANRCLLLCRRVVGKTWGISPRVMMWVYITMIRPIISYAAVVWAVGLGMRTCELKLSSLQRRACIAVSSAFPGTPTAALQMLLGLPPLTSFIEGVAMSGAYRLQQLGLWRGGYVRDTLAHQSHVNWYGGRSANLPVLAFPGDLCMPRLNLQARFKTSLEVSDHTGESSAVVCYTDGSKLESGRTGAGVHFPGGKNNDIVKYLGYNSSVFQAEIVAITLAAERLTSFVLQEPEAEEIIIYSDSQAAIKAVVSLRTRSHMVNRCVEALNSLGHLTDVTLRWVKAHAGTIGNETADFLAKEAAMMSCAGPEPFLPAPLSACKLSVYRWIEEDSKKRWNNLSFCRQTKELFEQPLRKRGCQSLLSLTRRKLRLTLQILTGHGNIGTHNKTTRKWDNDTCRRCGLGPETRTHIVEDCPAYTRCRFSFLDGHLTDLQKIVKSLCFSHLSTFLERIGRLEDFNV